MFRRHARPQPELAAPSSWQGLVHLLAAEETQPQGSAPCSAAAKANIST